MMKKILLLLLVFLVSCSKKIDNNSLKIDFVRQESNTAKSFRGLAVVNSNTVWTTGSGGTVLRTVDGGNSWLNVSPEGFNETGFRDIHAWNENEAIIMGVGSPAVFLKTKDGGNSWKEVYRNELENIFFDSIEFWNDSVAIGFSDPIDGKHYIIKTADQGENWSAINPENIPSAANGEAAFAASGTCIATLGDSLAWFVTGGTEARVFLSKDQGETWDVINSPIICGLQTTGIYSVDFVDENNGIIVGGDYTRDEELNANAAVTNDGGKNWKLLENKPKGFKSCVKFIPGIRNGVIALGTSGTDVSDNSGASWRMVDTVSFNTIEFYKNGLGWAVGDKGLIYKVNIKKEK